MKKIKRNNKKEVFSKWKSWGNSKGYKYSLYLENGDLVAQGTLQLLLEDLLFNKSYSKLLDL